MPNHKDFLAHRELLEFGQSLYDMLKDLPTSPTLFLPQQEIKAFEAKINAFVEKHMQNLEEKSTEELIQLQTDLFNTLGQEIETALLRHEQETLSNSISTLYFANPQIRSDFILEMQQTSSVQAANDLLKKAQMISDQQLNQVPENQRQKVFETIPIATSPIPTIPTIPTIIENPQPAQTDTIESLPTDEAEEQRVAEQIKALEALGPAKMELEDVRIKMMNKEDMVTALGLLTLPPDMKQDLLQQINQRSEEDARKVLISAIRTSKEHKEMGLTKSMYENGRSAAKEEPKK